MFSRILVKLIDQAIVPAVLLLATKIIGIVLVSRSAHIPFGFDVAGFNFLSPQDFIHVNSLSTALMVVPLTLGLAYILIKSYVFHDTHITPKMTARMFELRLDSLIQSTYDLYTQGAIWLSYLFFITIAAALMAFAGLVYVWVFYLTLALALLMTLFFIFDIENELKEAK